MYTKGDFHMHTTASDGGLSPLQLLDIVSKKGFDVISITDHDTLDSLENGIKAGKSLGVKVIPGIELSTIYNGETVHILGYFKNEEYKNKDFNKFLQDIQSFRIARSKKIIANLKKFFNIDIDYQKVLHDAKGVIARPHIAKAIIEKGYNYSWDYIFSNIINSSSPAYVPNKKISTEEGINLLKNLNAVVVLAHPVLIKKTPMEDMLELPFDGIEAIYPLNNSDEEEKFIKLAKKTGKLVTAGSDFHGINDKDSTHGTLGDVCLKGDYLDKFLNEIFK
ncbi:PHP domain-containing protein [Haloimpatiens lingqiaonensis]|uniref:PHP domain-containing protein n=1 Tax=Haloimpatiens lingqiaonensis TaxID=1380675 RepID=UPI0010FD63EE|nr:PHP domain-containing protein [Haloimpatiens lingqiaonensis]